MSDSVDDLFAGRPSTVFIEGVGEVPVVYEDAPVPEILPSVDVGVAYCRAEGIQWTEVAPETVLWNQQSRVSQVLDPIAALLWQCFDGTGSFAEISADLAAAFGRPVEEVSSDFGPAVSVWLRDGFLADANQAGERSSFADDVEGIESSGWRYLADPPND